MRRTAFLIGLVLLHIGLSLWYASVTPYRTPGILFSQRGATIPDIGAPDELQHTNYVQHLLDGKGFPVLVPGAPDLAFTYQSHQPPAFYILDAAWIKLLGVTDVSDPSAALKLRSLNAIIGATTVVGAFFLGLWGFRRSDVAAAMAVFAGFMPMMIALSSAVSNDPLLYCICTWTLALSALCIQEGWTVKRSILMGVLLGLGIYAKTTAISLFAIVLLAMVIRRETRPVFKQALIVFGLAVVIALPWWIRNTRLYGDPLAMRVFIEAFQGSPKRIDMQMALGPGEYWLNWFGWWTARSFVGAFGYMDIWLNSTGTAVSSKDPNALYRLVLASLLILSFAWLFSLKEKVWKPTFAVQTLCGAFVLIIFALCLQFNLAYFQAQARYLYPAIGAFSGFWAIGLLHLSKHRWRLAVLGVLAFLLGLNLYALNRLPGEFQKRIVPSTMTGAAQRQVSVRATT